MASVSQKSQLGRHILIDFFGVKPNKLQQKKKLMTVLCAALRENGFNIIERAIGHKFRGGGKGVTGFVLLAQSHAAFHSYPEYGYIAFDIYTCGSHDPKPVVQTMASYLCPKKVSRFFHRRGAKVDFSKTFQSYSKYYPVLPSCYQNWSKYRKIPRNTGKELFH